jgi:hypothetical protein
MPRGEAEDSHTQSDRFDKIPAMRQSLSIAEFITQTGAQARFFDMGRRVVEIPADTLRAFEQAQLPYPYPFQRHAWLGIVFFHEHNLQHQVWFLKLPLDEQGLLLQVARDDFLRRIATSLLSKEDKHQALDDNPHGFTPRDERMAMFHAKVSRELNQDPSQFFAHAVDYFNGQLGFEQWNFVGLQGIADVVARRDERHQGQTLEQTLIRAIPQLPETPFTVLCTCLENEAITQTLGAVLAAQLPRAIQDRNPALAAAIIRGLSQCQATATLHNAIYSMLDSDYGRHIEVLAAISGRAWEALQDPELRLQFLENLAHCETGQQAFNAIITDLLFLPGLRQPLLADFHNAQRSEKLAHAVDTFLQASKAP